MLRKPLLSLVVVAGFALVAALSGCESKTTIGVQAVEGCELDLENLEGMYIAQKAAPDRGEFLDKDFRIKFYKEGDARKAISTGGRIFPQLPLTQKFQYELKEIRELPSGEKEAFYFADLAKFHGFNEEELAKKKAENKDLGWKLEGMLYIRVDDKRCRLKISDMYATMVEGKRVEDFNMGGQSAYVKSEETRYSMVDCPQAYHRDRPEDNRQGELIPWKMAEPDPNKDESFPRDRTGTRVPKGEEIYWMYIDTTLTEKEAPEGWDDCTYYLATYVDDLPVDSLQKVEVTPGAKWTYWSFPMTHEAADKATFIEIHRHRVCGGVDTTIDAVCNVFATEPDEAAGEGEGEAEGEAEAG